MSTLPRKQRIYLAGPISGCNPVQLHGWREAVKARYAKQFEFIDPAEDVLPREGVDFDNYELIVRDTQDVLRSDAVVANMWRESIGTALGIMQARIQGKPVVVIDPNHIGNRILEYYADAVEASPDAALESLIAILGQQQAVRRVLKRGGVRKEPFERNKLILSIRYACLAAGKNDVIAPVEIVPRVLRRIYEGAERTSISSAELRDAVWETLREMEADPLRVDDFYGIRVSWEAFDDRRRSKELRVSSGTNLVQVHERPRSVRIQSGKSHSTIWGPAVKRAQDLPPRVRQAFNQICRVDGIKEIQLTSYGKGPKSDEPRFAFHASKTPGVIEGKLYDNGKRGQIQNFRISLHDPECTEDVRVTLVKSQELGLLRRARRKKHTG